MGESYRDHRYPAKLDLDAPLDLYRGPSLGRRIKAGIHCGEYVVGLTIGDPDGAQPVTATGPAEGLDPEPTFLEMFTGEDPEDLDEMVAEAEPFTEAELVEAKAAQEAGSKQGIVDGFAEVAFALRVLKLLRDKSPELYAAFRGLLARIIKEKRAA